MDGGGGGGGFIIWEELEGHHSRGSQLEIYSRGKMDNFTCSFCSPCCAAKKQLLLAGGRYLGRYFYKVSIFGNEMLKIGHIPSKPIEFAEFVDDAKKMLHEVKEPFVLILLWEEIYYIHEALKKNSKTHRKST